VLIQYITFYEHNIFYKRKEAYHFIKLLVVSFREKNALCVGDLTHASYPHHACALTTCCKQRR